MNLNAIITATAMPPYEEKRAIHAERRAIVLDDAFKAKQSRRYKAYQLIDDPFPAVVEPKRQREKKCAYV